MKNDHFHRYGLRGRILFIVWLGCSILFPFALSAQDTEWTLKPLPITGGWLEDLFFLDQQTGWVSGIDDALHAIILKTTNAGDDWTTQLTVPGSEIYGLHFADADTGYAVGMKDFKTTNGGTDWIEQAVHNVVWERLYDVFCTGATEVVSVGKGNQQNQCLIYRTTDGETWSKPAYPAISGQLNAVTFADAEHGWAVGYKNGSTLPLILHTSDGGANWTEQPNPATAGELKRVFFFDERNGWAVGGTGITEADSVVFLKTENGGTTWIAGNEPPGTMATSVHLVSVTEGYVVVNERAADWSATLYHTEDGGETWTEALAAVDGGYFGNVQIVRGSPGSLAKGKAAQQNLTAFGVGSKDNGPMFGKAAVHVDPGSQVARIDVTPSTVSLHVGQTQIFKAKGYDQAGNEVQITPIWSATGGSIDQDGKYTTTETGDFTVTASVQGSDVKGAAAVHVDPGSQVARIDVTPNSMSLHVGQTQIFTAKGYDQVGNEFSITPIWSATGGTIDQDGKYTANETGDFTVTASVQGSSVTGKASVHVDPASQFTRIDVAPSNVSLKLGDIQLFTAKGYDQYGSRIPFIPKWSATGGTITRTQGTLMKVSSVDSSTATYTALEAGDHTVVCRDSTTGIADTAFVEVMTGVIDHDGLPDGFVLHQNFPNPFNPTTTIRFTVKEPSGVLLKVFDVSGREIRTLVDGKFQPGHHQVLFDARDLPSGIYMYRIRMGIFTEVKKMLLLE